MRWIGRSPGAQSMGRSSSRGANLAGESEPEERRYAPGGAGSWRAMASELWLYRELAWRFFLRDFTARYRQSLFGYAWAILPALVAVGTFAWLNRARLLPGGDTAEPYPLYVLLGVTVWQLFAQGLLGATQSL